MNTSSEAGTAAQPELEAPILPVRDMVLFPGELAQLYVGRWTSVQALVEAYRAPKRILVVAQRAPEQAMPGEDDLFGIGTLATLMDCRQHPDGYLVVSARGDQRARLLELTQRIPCLTGRVQPLREPSARDVLPERERVLALAQRVARRSPHVPIESLRAALQLEDPARLAGALAASLLSDVEQRQQVLEAVSVSERTERLMLGLASESAAPPENHAVGARLKSLFHRWRVDRLRWNG